MLKVHITESQKAILNHERFHYPCPLVQKRMHTLYLKTKKYTHQQIADIVDISANSVTNYLKMYQAGGIESLKKINYGTNTSQLDTFRDSLEEEFRQNPPHSTNEAMQRIETMTGIRRSPSRVKAFMKRIGLKYRKTGHIPAKADPQKQAQWLKDTLEPYIVKAQQGLCHLFFMDAAHFVLNAFLCSLWSFVRVFVKAPAGRQRLNVLGAVHAISKKVEFLTNNTYINANVIADFLRQLAANYSDLPIIIVLDNARYQHCQFIKDLSKPLGITLLFLPSYSPNLNIIERLWKFIKKKALYAQYYESFEEFKQGIISTLIKVNHNLSYIQEVRSLLTLKFQTFENSQIY